MINRLGRAIYSVFFIPKYAIKTVRKKFYYSVGNILILFPEMIAKPSKMM